MQYVCDILREMNCRKYVDAIYLNVYTSSPLQAAPLQSGKANVFGTILACVDISTIRPGSGPLNVA